MLPVLLRCLGRAPKVAPIRPEGLVGLCPLELAPALRRDDDDIAPGLTAGVLTGLLGDGDR